jgi:ABC-type branched-subunit amino acid transport system ATPase component
VVGPNGSGKSTLMKALTGLVRLSSGRAFVGERDITGLAPEEIARAGVGYVPQIDDVFAPLTVRENLEMGGYLLPGREVSARIDHVVRVFPRLGQMLTRRAGRLSGGERKMLAMGRVLMLQPAVFLLDEPTANLAPKVAAELLTEHVRTLAEAGAAVLIVEQRARAVLAISDYTYVLGGGQVLMADTPARLSASQEFTESFFGAVPQSPKLPALTWLRGTDRGWCRPGRRTPGSYDSGRRSRTDGPPQPAGCPSAAAASWPWRRVRPSRRHAASRRSTA